MITKQKLKHLALLAFSILLIAALPSAVYAQDPDDDGDGLPNGADTCPNDPGPRENGGCPVDDGSGEMDRDLDGMPDSTDFCPDVSGPPENGGCPLPDDPEPDPEQPIVPPGPPALLSNACRVTTTGNQAVNIRSSLGVQSPIVDSLQPGEWRTIIRSYYDVNLQVWYELLPSGYVASFADIQLGGACAQVPLILPSSIHIGSETGSLIQIDFPQYDDDNPLNPDEIGVGVFCPDCTEIVPEEPVCPRCNIVQAQNEPDPTVFALVEEWPPCIGCTAIVPHWQCWCDLPATDPENSQEPYGYVYVIPLSPQEPISYLVIKMTNAATSTVEMSVVVQTDDGPVWVPYSDGPIIVDDDDDFHIETHPTDSGAVEFHLTMPGMENRATIVVFAVRGITDDGQVTPIDALIVINE